MEIRARFFADVGRVRESCHEEVVGGWRAGDVPPPGSSRRPVVWRHAINLCPSHNEVGGLSFDVGAGRTAFDGRCSAQVRGKMVGDEHSTSERTLSLREYKALLKTRDPGRLKIKKTRRAFLWRDEYYMLDTFHSPESASGADSVW